MKIAIAQIRSDIGDIPKNIQKHVVFTNLAAVCDAELIVFPELSITGYEPKLAEELASVPEDRRFDDLQHIADSKKIVIGAGMPLRTAAGDINIGMILFRPDQAREVYTKQYLHPDEEPYFVSRTSDIGLLGNSAHIALAICYEIAVPAHSADAAKRGAKIYLASVAKSIKGVQKAHATLSEIAARYGMTVLLSNCIGIAEGEECGGKTAIWNEQGVLVAQLGDVEEGLLILDTETGTIKNYT